MIKYSQLVQDVHDGNESPLKAYGVLKSKINTLEKFLDEIKEYAIMEAEKYNESTFTDFNMKFEKRKGGVSYSYKHIDEVVSFEEKLKQVKEKYKNAYISRMKGLNSVTDDGEILQMPMVSYRKDSLSVKEL